MPQQEGSSIGFSPQLEEGVISMNKIKLLTIAGSLVMASSLLVPTVADAGSRTSGTTCMAANLTQALKGIGWSQAGVVNNATSSFFVVCPMLWGSNTQTAFRMGASFPGSGTVECTVRLQHHTTGSYTGATFTVSSGQNTGNPNNGINGVSQLDFTNVRNGTVVCALDPGEGIEWVFPLGSL